MGSPRTEEDWGLDAPGRRGEADAPGADARGLPDGTLVTCEHCPTPHPKGDDGRPCRFPKVAAPSTGPAFTFKGQPIPVDPPRAHGKARCGVLVPAGRYHDGFGVHEKRRHCGLALPCSLHGLAVSPTVPPAASEPAAWTCGGCAKPTGILIEVEDGRKLCPACADRVAVGTPLAAIVVSQGRPVEEDSPAPAANPRTSGGGHDRSEPSGSVAGNVTEPRSGPGGSPAPGTLGVSRG